jgi:hypothetical protein
MTEGDSLDVYFQLVDLSRDRAVDGFVPEGRRYVPAAAATLTVVLQNIDDARKVTKTATQPYSQDPSIWKFSISSSDTIRGTVNAILTLTEGSKVTKGLLSNAIGVQGLDGMSRL